MASTSGAPNKKKYESALTEAQLLEELEKGLSDIDDLDENEENEDEEESVVIRRRVGDPLPDPSEYEENQCENADDDNNAEEADVADVDEAINSFYENIVSDATEYTFTNKKDIEWMKNKQFLTRHLPEQPEDMDADEFVHHADYPMTYFAKYVPESLLEQFVHYTNLYATQNKQTHFKQVNLQQMKIFFGLHIITGCLKFPRLRMYWDRHLHIDLFPESMGINRFFKLRTNLHCVNNLEDQNPYDKMWKVRPIFDSILKQCKKMKVETNVCVDEQIVPFKGRSIVKQLVRGKPHPWGIKLFLLCGASGYMYNFIIYQGKTTELEEGNLKRFGHGPSVVLKLSDRLEAGHPHKMFFDNYFTSYNLLEILNERPILAAGTVRVNRFANPPFTNGKVFKKKDRGSSEEVISRNGIVAVKWLDSRPVILASNFIGIGDTDKVKRWDKINKEHIQVSRPEVIKEYNTSMGGVDKMDFLVAIYRTRIRTKKWTLRMIFHAIDLAIVNSWIEYRNDCVAMGIPAKKIMDLLHFKIRVGEALVKTDVPSAKKRGRPSLEKTAEPPNKRNTAERVPLNEVRKDQVGHLPVHTPGIPQRCKNPDCPKGKNGKSRWKCVKCNARPIYV